jgi:hypothetical protein
LDVWLGKEVSDLTFAKIKLTKAVEEVGVIAGKTATSDV